MSPADLVRPQTEVAGHSSKGLDPQPSYKSSGDVYNHPTMDDFYLSEDDDCETPKSLHRKMDAPMLPQKSSLRASRLLDNMSVKSSISAHAPELSQATLHDVYLSSEEDASSSADDFSEYDWDSGTDDTDVHSPRRDSHEAEAKVVSVIFMGKPSIIDLPTQRRSISPISAEVRRRASTISSTSPPHSAAPSLRTSTMVPSDSRPSSSSTHHQQSSSPRKSSLVSSLLSRKQPLFLNIDPYANGSSYSLDTTSSHHSNHADDESPLKTPRTPTFLKNMSKSTMSLVRKRSRPLLNMLNTEQSQLSATTINENEVGPSSVMPPQRSVTEPIKASSQQELPQPSPSPTVTYKDIIKAANRNSMMLQHHPQPSPIAEHHSPITPSSSSLPHTHKRGILGGLTSRRKSIKWSDRLI